MNTNTKLESEIDLFALPLWAQDLFGALAVYLPAKMRAMCCEKDQTPYHPTRIFAVAPIHFEPENRVTSLDNFNLEDMKNVIQEIKMVNVHLNDDPHICIVGKFQEEPISVVIFSSPRQTPEENEDFQD